MKLSMLMVLVHNALHAGSHEVVIPGLGAFPVTDCEITGVRTVKVQDSSSNTYVFTTQEKDEDSEAGTLARIGFTITRERILALGKPALTERGVIEGKFTRKMSAMIHKELESRTIAVA